MKMIQAARWMGLILMGAATGSGLGACQSGSPNMDNARVYPETLLKAETLDIQVVRGETTLTLTNTTARVFGPSTLWLNAYYSRPLEGLAVGQSLTIPLSEFRNEFGESFRGGGFFATRRPERMVLAQLEHDGSLHGLVVIRGEPVLK